MKTNIFLQLFAAIVRNFFPRFAVKCFTKKINSNAVLYLPSVQKQLQLIDKLGLSADELRERVWSLDTKIELFRKGEYALLAEIRTEREFETIAASADINRVAQAMKYYTPNKAGMLRLLHQYGLEALDLVKAVPSAFDSLAPWEVLGVGEKEAAPVADDRRWAFAEALVCAKSSWAPKFMLELRKIVPQKLGEIGREYFELFFNRAFEAKEDIAELMPYMAVFFPELYAKVRENYYLYSDFSAYFCMMFPQLRKHLGGHAEVKNLYGVALSGNLVENDDAYAWLSIGVCRLSDARIYGCILSSLAQLKKMLSSEAYVQLFGLMADRATSTREIEVLMALKEEVYKTRLREKLVACGASGALQKRFPFADWDNETAKKALEVLAEAGIVPVKRLGELTPALQKVAIKAIENQAEIAAVKADAFTAVEYHLCPAAEGVLFSLDFRCQKYKLLYIEKYKIADVTFLYMLNKEFKYSDDKGNLFELVGAYARKWGLTREQYLAILQSKIKENALSLKSFVKDEEPKEGHGDEM